MLDIPRNMLRRKTRTGLTILGIVIGVFALTVMGAMAEKVNKLVAGGQSYYTGHIIVSQTGNGGPLPIAANTTSEIARIPGVAAVVPVVDLPLKDTDNGGDFLIPNFIEGQGVGFAGYDHFGYPVAHGSLPPLTERGVVAVGSSVARQFKLHVGDPFVVRGHRFLVRAIFDTTMTMPDSMVRMNLRDAQDLALASLPAMLRATVQPDQLVTGLNVYPRPGIDGDRLAARIKHAGIAGLSVLSPSEARKQFEQFSTIFNLVILGSTLIALVVGGLSVINTMAMAVSERIKEIGLKKAIGARTGQVLREFLAEAAGIGLIAGLIGLGLGCLFTGGINAANAMSGTQVFVVTTRLALGTVIFATILGTAAGFVPALHASRLHPVDALRAE